MDHLTIHDQQVEQAIDDYRQTADFQRSQGIDLASYVRASVSLFANAPLPKSLEEALQELQDEEFGPVVNERNPLAPTD